MKRITYILLATVFFISSCSKVPVTGRKQLNLLPESSMIQMSLASYSEFLNTNSVVTSGGDAVMLKRVGDNIAASATAYLKKHKQLKRVENFQWEFNLVQDDLVNAWCMPGGKVVFYTGIMPITQNETGTAVVMGHEVAHAIARHGNERMSQQLGLQLGGSALAVALSNKPAQTQQLFNSAYGLGANLGVILPFSRRHESEADKMGLIFMAMAGYNPSEAPAFWGRMSASSQGQPPEFLSTHPSHETRIKDLEDFLPTAMEYYRGGNSSN